MNNEFEVVWNESVVACFNYYCSVCLKDLRRATARFIVGLAGPYQNSNLGLAEYEASLLTITPRSLIVLFEVK